MKKLMLLAAMLAMVVAMAAVPAFAQNAAETNADQSLTGPTDVSSTSAAEQGAFSQDFVQTQTIDNAGGGDVLALQTGVQTGAQVQVPVSAAVNAQQVPVSAALNLDALINLLLGL